MDDGCMDDVQHHNISYNPRTLYSWTPGHLDAWFPRNEEQDDAVYGILNWQMTLAPSPTLQSGQLWWQRRPVQGAGDQE